MKNGFEIIDFHVHPFINESRNMCFYEDTVNGCKDFKQVLQRAGIDKVCGSVIERTGETESFDKIRLLNDEALRLKEVYGDFYIPGIHIHQHFPDESIDELKRMNKSGVKLIGELVPYMMGWESYYDEGLDEVYREADRLDMVVSLHTMAEYEESMETVVKRFPNIQFVAAHPNDKKMYLRHIERMKKYENYYLDLSGTGIFRYGLINYGIKEVGSERFLFGTDFPICNPGMYVEAVLFEKLKEGDYENIFSKNAKRLLGLC